MGLKEKVKGTVGAAIVAASLGMGTLAAGVIQAGSADAWAWSGGVTLAGKATCGGWSWSPKAKWIWVEADNGERGWATLDQNTGNYSFRFSNIGGGNGTWVTARWDCVYGTRGKVTGFGVARPSSGDVAWRNLY